MKYYVVSQVTGDWDSAWSTPIFVTDKEYKAKFYCGKGNAILERYRQFYKDKLNSIHLSDDLVRDNYLHYSERNDLVVGSFHYSELVFKKNIKV